MQKLRTQAPATLRITLPTDTKLANLISFSLATATNLSGAYTTNESEKTSLVS